MSSLPGHRYFDGEPYKVAEIWCHDTGWKCGCGVKSDTLQDLKPVGDCALTPGDASPAGRCPDCDALVYPESPLNPGLWVTPIPVLCTSHIQESTSHLLNRAAAFHDTRILRTHCAGYSDGWFLLVPESEGDEHPDLPIDLKSIFAWARSRKYPWVRLDPIGDETAALTTFSW